MALDRVEKGKGVWKSGKGKGRKTSQGPCSWMISALADEVRALLGDASTQCRIC